MAWYRKIDVRILNDEKFRKLSDDGKLVFFILLVHPAMTAIGAMRGTLPGLGAEIGWDAVPDRFTKAFDEAASKGMAKHDPIASVIWLPNFIRYNAPENPNVLKSWVLALDLLPECDLTTQAIQSVKAFAYTLTPSFAKAFEEAFAKPSPKQEQEQQQEQQQENPRRAPTSSDAGFALSSPNKPVKIANGSPISMRTFFARCKAAGVEPIPEDAAVHTYAEKAKIPPEFVTLAWKVFRAKYQDSGKRYIDWRLAFKNYIEQAGYGLWAIDAASNQYVLTASKGRQAQRAHAK